MTNEKYDFENLNIGVNSIMVYILQKNLNQIGADLKEDGIFGDKTDKTVKAFQEEHNLENNGIVDYKTMLEIDYAYQLQNCKAV